MNKQSPRALFLAAALTACALMGCSHIEVNETESQESSVADDIPETFSVNDIFVSGNPFWKMCRLC